jgi:pimeloyl-ACP methyl ester carboxylesterase
MVAEMTGNARNWALAVVMGCLGLYPIIGQSLEVPNFVMNPADYCKTENGVSKVNVPLYPGKSGSPTFPFSYKFFQSGDPKSPTVIVLPGGPGDTLLDPKVHSPTESFPYGAIPTTFNIIYTEPRGLGCNQLAQGDFPADAFASAYSAADVVAIIRDRKLDNYFLYGASFGTVVATYVADQVNSAGVNKPRAVVLEGTFGHGVQGKFDEYVGEFTAQWESTKANFSAPLKKLFESDPLPLGFSGEAWGSYIFWQLITYGPGLIAYSPIIHAGDVVAYPPLQSVLTTYDQIQ